MLRLSSSLKDKGKRSKDSLPDASQVGSLQIILWTLWTAAVISTGCLQWQSALLAQSAVDISGLILHTSVVGVIGLVILTLIEMQLEPWRFWK